MNKITKEISGKKRGINLEVLGKMKKLWKTHQQVMNTNY